MGRLHAEVTNIGDVNHVVLAGVIDEDNDLSAITPKLTHKAALLTASDVERINSCGVRDWVTWLGELEQKGIAVFLLECSPAIMTQVNLVNNFVGHGTILSFYAPYFCPPPCEADQMLLIDIKDALKTTPFHAPPCRCNVCDKLMEFDDIESSYFGFLSTTKAPEISPEVEKALAQISSKKGSVVRTRSASIPMASSAGGATSPATPVQGGSIPTAGGSALKGLLTDIPASTESGGGQNVANEAVQPQRSGTNPMVYVIAGLLGVAVILLVFAVLR